MRIIKLALFLLSMTYACVPEPVFAVASPLYFPNLGLDATGTTVGSSNSLDVNIVQGTVNATNPSVGVIPSPVPTQATYVGVENQSGNLVGLALGQSTMSGSLPVAISSNQSAIPVTQSGTWTVQPGNTANTTPWLETISQGGNSASVTASSALKVDGSAVTQPVSGTFWQTTQPVSGTFWQTTQPVSAASLPLPAGASTSALQTTANTSLSAIQTSVANIPAQGQALSAASLPVVLPAAQITTLTPPTSVTVTQATASNLNATVTGTVSTKAPINANATLSARQTVTGTETNLAAPSNAVAVIIECESVNADNLRWGFSNSSSAILSSTLGMLCEPGRSENIPVGVGTYLHMISTGAGSDFMDVQWILSQ